MIIVMGVAEDAIDRAGTEAGLSMGAVYALVKIRAAVSDGPKSVAEISRRTGMDRNKLRANIATLAGLGMLSAIGIAAAGMPNAAASRISENAAAGMSNAAAGDQNAAASRISVAASRISENAAASRISGARSRISGAESDQNAAAGDQNAAASRISEPDLGHIYTSSLRDIPSKVSAGDEVDNLIPLLPLLECPSQKKENVLNPPSAKTRTSRAEAKARRAEVAGEAFERFWAAWRKERRVKPDKAAAAFRAAVLRGADPEEIIAGAARYTAHEIAKGTPVSFIAHPTTWLGDGRWRDELPEADLPPTPGRLRDLARVEQALLDATRNEFMPWQASALMRLGRLTAYAAGDALPVDGVAEVEAMRSEIERLKARGVRLPNIRATAEAAAPQRPSGAIREALRGLLFEEPA
ncbi:hypothetical protein [Falsiroseomonas sp. CW058]|uniref:hypothetical protein n=1 Tax=Falsiroseomonas sp. CW058 TaxID=3388664 RepID=UPI003D3171A6